MNLEVNIKKLKKEKDILKGLKEIENIKFLKILVLHYKQFVRPYV